MSAFPEAVILKVDLTEGNIEREILPGEVYRQYPGGSSLGAYLLLKNMPPGADPLSADNVLVFAVSPLTGLPVGGLSRVSLVAASPLTGGIGDSQAGGTFPAELKANGIDAVVFTGKARSPVYLHIRDGGAELRPADHLWGKTTGDVEDLLFEELNDRTLEIAQIGPAGENGVRYACVVSACTRANGRTGMGAVMGSKNLKALVLSKGTGRKPADPEGVKKLYDGLDEKLKGAFWTSFRAHGTSRNVEIFHEMGYLPTKNWTTGRFPEGAHQTTGSTMTETVLKSDDTCFACPIRCKRVVEIPGVVDPRYGGPEYETMATFGSYCGISSLESICRSNQLCNMYGLDTISCGATLAFAMECYEKGLLTREDTGGLELNFGAADAVNECIPLIALRKGFGARLAEGSRRMAEEMGGEALNLAIVTKGKEYPAHMPQLKPAVGLIYAVNPFGPDHQSSGHDIQSAPEGSELRRRLGLLGLGRGEFDKTSALDDYKVRFALHTQYFYSLLDTLCLCQFAWGPTWQLWGPDDILTLCKAGIGWDTSIFELMQIGERRLNMMRQFNAREGFTREQDTLPDRFFQPLQDKPSQGDRLDRENFERAKETYYAFAGWDPRSGNPTPEKLRMLSLDWLLP